MTITGANVTVAAGPPAKGATAYTGEIKLLAKTITMEAEEQIMMQAEKNVALVSTGAMRLEAKDLSLEISNDLQAQVTSNLSMQAGGKAKLSSADTDVI